MLKDDGHYKPFNDIHDTNTLEEYRPSLQRSGNHYHSIYASVQHVKNSGMMLCEECGMWWLIYATRKLLASEKQLLGLTLDDLSFSCGSPLQEAELPQELLSVVDVRSLPHMS